MERYKGTYDSFFGIEHTMSREEMLTKKRSKDGGDGGFAAETARVTDDGAGKHTTG